MEFFIKQNSELPILKMQVVRDGRLINQRTNGMTGIAEAANLRRMKKNLYKEQCIANGIEMAEMRKDMRKMF